MANIWQVRYTGSLLVQKAKQIGALTQNTSRCYAKSKVVVWVRACFQNYNVWGFLFSGKGPIPPIRCLRMKLQSLALILPASLSFLRRFTALLHPLDQLTSYHNIWFGNSLGYMFPWPDSCILCMRGSETLPKVWSCRDTSQIPKLDLGLELNRSHIICWPARGQYLLCSHMAKPSQAPTEIELFSFFFFFGLVWQKLFSGRGSAPFWLLTLVLFAMSTASQVWRAHTHGLPAMHLSLAEILTIPLPPSPPSLLAPSKFLLNILNNFSERD